MLALEGLVVLDLARRYPGAYSAMFFADFGAEVIKVDPPVGGLPIQPENVSEEKFAAYYASDRNKKSIILNLKSDEGREAFHRLVKKADVLIEGFSPGVMKRLKTDYDSIRLPMGPAVQLQKARIVENVKVDNRVDKIISDTDLKAAEGMQMLYEKGIDEHVISQLLTLGTLGLKKNRRLVPTRWGITASDDALGKAIIDEIQDYGEIDEYRLYMGNYFGNYYYIFGTEL